MTVGILKVINGKKCFTGENVIASSKLMFSERLIPFHNSGWV